MTKLSKPISNNQIRSIRAARRTAMMLLNTRKVGSMPKHMFKTIHKDLSNNLFCARTIRGTYYIILDGPTFATARALMKAGIDPSMIIIVECDEKCYNAKVKANRWGFHLLKGRMEDKTDAIKTIIKDGSIGGIYFDGMSGWDTINAAIYVVDQLRDALIEETTVAVTWTPRGSGSTNVKLLAWLVEGLTAITPLFQLADRYGYGAARAKKNANQPMGYAMFRCTTEKVVAKYRNKYKHMTKLCRVMQHKQKARLLRAYPNATLDTKFEKILYHGFPADADWAPCRT
jgi:hypothetical protein